jgi:hypothetical protein
MNRTSPKTDVLTLIGMMATITGILVCLFFLFTPATFGAVETDTRTNASPDLRIAMRWIQPILGQAIVEDALIRYRSNVIAPVVDGSRTSASVSVQWVMGRIIVDLNRSRVVGGVADDLRITTIARHAGEALL